MGANDRVGPFAGRRYGRWWPCCLLAVGGVLVRPAFAGEDWARASVGARVSASSELGEFNQAEYLAAHAINGRTEGAYWCTDFQGGARPPHWIDVDLGRDREVGEVVLHMRTEAGQMLREFSIEAEVDDRWRILGEIREEPRGPDAHDVAARYAPQAGSYGVFRLLLSEPMRARRVRLTVEAPAIARLYEIEVRAPRRARKEDERNTISDASGLLRLDFGPPGSRVEEGWIPVSERTLFDDAAGYGWLDVDRLVSADRGIGAAMTRDLVAGLAGPDAPARHVFRLRVGDALRAVTVVSSDAAFPVPPFSVKSGRSREAFRSETRRPGDWNIVTFTAQPEDGWLDLVFEAEAGWAVNAVLLAPETGAEELRTEGERIARKLAAQAARIRERQRTPTAREIVQMILEEVPPLTHPRGDRIPMRLSRIEGGLPADDAEARAALLGLDARGIGMSVAARPHDAANLEEAVRMGRLQQELGLSVAVNASAALYGFFDGSEDTLHVDADGAPFHDPSFGRRRMGCPFRLGHRKEAIRAQVRSVLEAYRAAGVTVDFVYFDWEVDGPIEWNEAWAHARRCEVCRAHVPDLDHDFPAFQAAVRSIRSALQRACASGPVLAHFPGALVGNYAVYPHGGVRYWYDYFETLPEGVPFIAEQRARYRPWYPEFEETGYTFANPVVYTWYPTWSWYPAIDHDDYRWFYNMLRVGSNAAEHTPRVIPLIPWVHWHTTAPPQEAEPVPQMSEWAYRELLAHLFLRGADSLMMWCRPHETLDEVLLMQSAYDAVGAWPGFLAEGEPVRFDVPTSPGPVVSALRWGSKLLVRRTDFSDASEPVSIRVDATDIPVPRVDGQFQEIPIR